MTDHEAIKAMKDGKKVAHRHFTPEEWVKETGALYEFEDGCLCERHHFWLDRSPGSWLEGWRVV